MGDKNYLSSSTASVSVLNPIVFLRACFSLVFSFEFIFAIFLFAGVFKTNPKLLWIPVDLTGASFGLSALVGIYWLYRNNWRIDKKIFGMLVAFSLFFAWVLVSLAWSGSWLYGGKKAVHLAIIGLWGIFGCAVVIGPDKERLHRFCSSLVVLSLWMAFEVVIHIANGTLLEEWDFASNYLGLGRLLGLAVLVLVGSLLWGNPGKMKAVLVALLLVFLVSILMISGGRGPFLATLLALIVPAIRDSRFTGRTFLVKKHLLLFSGLMVVVLIGFMKIGNQYFGFTTIDRLWMFLEGGGGDSAHFRYWFFSKAYEFWLEAPLVGHGIGEFGTLLGWGDIRIYPHNIILEILVELGLVGLVFFFLSIYFSLQKLSLSLIRSDYFLAVLLMFVVNAFFNAMLTGDLPDNRVLFALLGLYAGRSVMTSEEKP